MSRWFRFYDDAMNDPKLLRLSDVMFRAWATLLCIASKHEGKLPPAADIALMLRAKPTTIAAWFTELTAAGLLDNIDGCFVPHNWDGRQYKSDTSNERVKRYRDKKRNVTDTVTVTVPEQKQTTEQKQSRADTPAAVVSDSEKELRSEISEALGLLEVSRTSLWLSKGYSSTMIAEVVKEVATRGTEVGSLNYFDTMLAERHASRPETPSERASAKVDMDKVAEMFKKTGVWSKYAGPEPGMIGCRCPAEILARHGIVTAGLRRMNS